MCDRDEETGGLERVGPSHRVEGVLQVVAARAHVDPFLQENLDGCK
jgi:hypothetical protein